MKATQILELYTRFQNGERLSKREMVTILDGKSSRTIQRFISTINSFLDESDMDRQIQYDKEANQFYMEYKNDKHFTAKQILLISKVLLSTRSLSNREISTILNDQIERLPAKEQTLIRKSIESEVRSYNSELDEQGLLDIIWELNELILQNKVIEIEYSNALNKVRAHVIKPFYVTFSEFYYYLIGAKENGDTLIFRVDRIHSLKVRRMKLDLELPHYMTEGELKKRIYFMYGGSLKTVKFEFSDGIIESVIDRFPTAELMKKDYSNNHFTVEVEVIGDGIIMWLLSQGSKVKVLSPVSIVDAYHNEVIKMYKNVVGD